jgi:hypothetical protein
LLSKYNNLLFWESLLCCARIHLLRHPINYLWRRSLLTEKKSFLLFYSNFLFCLFFPFYSNFLLLFLSILLKLSVAFSFYFTQTFFFFFFLYHSNFLLLFLSILSKLSFPFYFYFIKLSFPFYSLFCKYCTLSHLLSFFLSSSFIFSETSFFFLG